MANGNGGSGYGRIALEALIGILVGANLYVSAARWREDAEWKQHTDERLRAAETALTAITSNRFTAQDGFKLTLALSEAQATVAANQKEILRLQAQIEKFGERR